MQMSTRFSLASLNRVKKPGRTLRDDKREEQEKFSNWIFTRTNYWVFQHAQEL